MSESITDENGAQHWYQNGERHRLDGPAVIEANGARYWFQNGKRHRLDGPAVITHEGTQIWYQHDRRHRDGFLPALGPWYYKWGRQYTLKRLHSAGHVILRTMLRTRAIHDARKQYIIDAIDIWPGLIHLIC